MSLTDKLNKIKTALVGIETLETVYHYWRPVQTAPYCIWQEEGEDSSLEGDGHKQEQSISGTVDYFTKTENDPNIDAIQDALNGIDVCSWELEAVQYEEDTNLIHYSWTWTVA